MPEVFKIVYNYFGNEREVEAMQFGDGSIAIKGLDFDNKLRFFESIEEFFFKFKGVRCDRG